MLICSRVMDMDFAEIEIKGLPKFRFACSVDAENLYNYFEYKPDFLEISVHEEGRTAVYSLDGKLTHISQPHIISGIACDMAARTHSYNGERQKHTTVGVFVPYTIKRHKSEECDFETLRKRLGENTIALIPFGFDPGDKFELVLNAIKKIITFHSSPLHCDKMNAISAWFSLLGLLTDITMSELNALQSEFSPSEINYSLKATKYINENYAKKLTVSEIAAHLGISEGYLHRIFRNSQKRGIIEYINYVRIKNAISLVKNKGLSLKDASSSVGIDDPAYMSRLFKKTTGQSFREYFRTI